MGKYLLIPALVALILPYQVIALPTAPNSVITITAEASYGPTAPIAVDEEKHPKPIHDDSTLCNCWAYVQAAYYEELPSEAILRAGMSDAFGDIAVFYYPRQGLWHYAKVTGMGVGTFSIDEANYEGCERSQRDISFTDPHLQGFYAFSGT